MKKLIATTTLSIPLFFTFASAQPAKNLKSENFTDNFTVSLNFYVPTTIVFVSTTGHLLDNPNKPPSCNLSNDKCYFSIQDDGKGYAKDDNGYITYRVGDSTHYCQFTIYDGALAYAGLYTFSCSSGLTIKGFQEQGITNEYSFSIAKT